MQLRTFRERVNHRSKSNDIEIILTKEPASWLISQRDNVVWESTAPLSTAAALFGLILNSIRIAENSIEVTVLRRQYFLGSF
jgi:hypothetical protein